MNVGLTLNALLFKFAYYSRAEPDHICCWKLSKNAKNSVIFLFWFTQIQITVCYANWIGQEKWTCFFFLRFGLKHQFLIHIAYVAWYCLYIPISLDIDIAATCMYEHVQEVCGIDFTLDNNIFWSLQGLKIVDLQQSDYLRTLENAVQFGSPVLLQNVQVNDLF